MELPPIESIRSAVVAALAEDVGPGDVTTLAVVPEAAEATAIMVAREPLVVAGLDWAEETFRAVDPTVRVEKVSVAGQAARGAGPRTGGVGRREKPLGLRLKSGHLLECYCVELFHDAGPRRREDATGMHRQREHLARESVRSVLGVALL